MKRYSQRRVSWAVLYGIPFSDADAESSMRSQREYRQHRQNKTRKESKDKPTIIDKVGSYLAMLVALEAENLLD